MHKYVKELVGGSFIYGLSGMISSVIALFLVPIYTRVFTPSDYGVLNLVNVTYFLLTIFVIFGLDNSAELWYWEKTEEVERKKTFASWAYFLLSFSIAAAGVIWLFSKQISTLLFADARYYHLLNLMSVALVFTSLQRITNTWFRVRKKPFWAMSYALVASLTTIGLSILLVVKLDFGLSGVFWAQIGSSLVCFILSILLMYRWLLPRNFDFSRLREMLKFAVPLVPAAVSFWLMNSAGSYFIQHYTTSREVGLYQLGISLASVTGLATGAFLQVWTPFAFSISKEEHHRQTYADVFLLYVCWSGFAVLGVFLFAPEVLMILAPASFGGAAFVAGLISLNIIILGLPQIVAMGCALVKTNMPYSQAVIAGSIISVVLFTIIIPVAGKEGAVLATIVGNVFVFLYVYYKAQKLYFIPYNLPKAALILIGATALSLFGLWISHDKSLFSGLILKICLLLGYALFAIIFSYRIKNEKRPNSFLLLSAV